MQEEALPKEVPASACTANQGSWPVTRSWICELLLDVSVEDRRLCCSLVRHCKLMCKPYSYSVDLYVFLKKQNAWRDSQEY